MNKTFKYVIGGAVGGAIGYFVGSVIVEMIIYKAQLAEESDDYIDTDEVPQDESINVATPKKLVVDPPAKENYTKHFDHDVDRPTLDKLRSKYQAPIEDREPVEEEKSEMSEDENEENWEIEIDLQEDTDHEPIMVISMDEYASDDSMEHVTLRYYEDDIVTDEKDIPIDRPEKFLGSDALVSFGQLSQDEDIVYVRNLPKKCMYEVVRMNKEYSIMPNLRAQQMQKRREALSKKENETPDEEGRRILTRGTKGE